MRSERRSRKRSRTLCWSTRNCVISSKCWPRASARSHFHLGRVIALAMTRSAFSGPPSCAPEQRADAAGAASLPGSSFGTLVWRSRAPGKATDLRGINPGQRWRCRRARAGLANVLGLLRQSIAAGDERAELPAELLLCKIDED